LDGVVLLFVLDDDAQLLLGMATLPPTQPQEEPEVEIILPPPQRSQPAPTNPGVTAATQQRGVPSAPQDEGMAPLLHSATPAQTVHVMPKPQVMALFKTGNALVGDRP